MQYLYCVCYAKLIERRVFIMASQSEEIREIRQDLDDIKSLLASETNGHASYSRISREDAREWARKQGESVRAAYEQGRLQANELGAKYRSNVQENPVRSTALAFAGGWLLSRILRH
jgi:hypothetical protein